MIIDPKDLDAQSVYKLLIGSVVPRPIAETSWLRAPNATLYRDYAEQKSMQQSRN